MAFQLDFTGPYPNTGMCLGTAVVVCSLYVLFLHSDYFSI